MAESNQKDIIASGPEMALGTETPLPQVILDAVQRTDATLNEERAYGSRIGSCGLATDLTRHAIIYQSPGVKREGVSAISVNAWHLHSAASGISQEEVQEQITRIHRDLEYPKMIGASFIHQACIARVEGGTYLVDETFCQFMDQESGTVTAGRDKSTGVSTEDPFVQELYKNGAIMLTPQSLRSYLLVTSASSYHPEIPRIEDLDVDTIVNRVLPTEDSLERYELDLMVFLNFPQV